MCPITYSTAAVFVAVFLQAMFEDLSQLPDKKVMFDVTGSDISSAVEPQDGTGNTHIATLHNDNAFQNSLHHENIKTL